MSLKPFVVAVGLFAGSICLAVAESNKSSSADSSQSRSSTKDQTTKPSSGTTTNSSPGENREDQKKPDMADYCREHTC
jgi:hypothetical protein